MSLVGVAGTCMLVFVMLQGISSQHFMLKSEPPNLGVGQVCPVTVEVTCMGVEVGTLAWYVTINGNERLFAQHLGGVGGVYEIKLNISGISYLMPTFYRYDPLFDVNATILVPLSSVVNQNIVTFYCGLVDSSVLSIRYFTGVTIIEPPPPLSVAGCCIPSDSVSSDQVTCSIRSSNEISFSWSSQYSSTYHVDKYRLVFDDRLVVSECLTEQYINPNQSCTYSVLNKGTEYTFSITALNCGSQESTSTNVTISLISLQEPASLQGVSVRPVYGSTSFQLTQIRVMWNYLEARCAGIDYNYVVNLNSSSGSVIASIMVACTDEDICESTLPVSSYFDFYIIEIYAYFDFESSSAVTSYVSAPIDYFSSLQPNNYVEFGSCSVKCYSSFNGTCELEYIQNSTTMLQGSVNGTVNFDDIKVPAIQSGIIYYSTIFNVGGNIYTLQNSTIIQHDGKWTGRTLACVILGLILVLISILLIIILGVDIYWHWIAFKESTCLKAIFLSTILLSLVFILIFLSCWIAGIVEVTKSDNCESVQQPLLILITACVFSGSSVLLDVVCICCILHLQKKGKHTQQSNLNEPESWEKKDEVKKWKTDKLGMLVYEDGVLIVEKHLSVSGHKAIGEKTTEARIRVQEQRTCDDEVKKWKTDKLGMLVDEHGEQIVERNMVVSGHRAIGEKMKEARIRVQEQRTREVKKLIEAETVIDSNVYSQTEHVGPSSNQKKKPKPGSNYSNMGKKPAVSSGDGYYRKLQHNNSASVTSGAHSPDVFSTAITTATTSSGLSSQSIADYSHVGTQWSELPHNNRVSAEKSGSGSEYSKLEDQEGSRKKKHGKNRRKHEETGKRDEGGTVSEA